MNTEKTANTVKKKTTFLYRYLLLKFLFYLPILAILDDATVV
jgi:hypothetical protein